MAKNYWLGTRLLVSVITMHLPRVAEKYSLSEVPLAFLIPVLIKSHGEGERGHEHSGFHYYR